MRKSLLLSLLAPFIMFAQTQTLTLRPNAATGKDAMALTSNPTGNYGNYKEFDAIDWTVSGNPFTLRSFIYFDLSAIPGGATILSANLNLYGIPINNNPQGSTGSNSCYLQSITAPWSESTVNWNNQPATTMTNQVMIAQSTSIYQNYLNINVLNLVNDQIANSYYGFMIRLVSETVGNSMVFGSSDNLDSTKWPMLQIQYTLSSSSCLTFQPDAATGKDAFVLSLNPATNYGSYPEFDAISWTNGPPFDSRSLIQFDLTAIPTTATVTSAVLSLYGDTSVLNPQGSTGANDAYLNMITASWVENTVTWNNQPTTTTLNQITIPQSTSTSQNYPSVNILNFAQNWVSSPSTNYGMMMQLQTEATYRSLVLCSSDYTYQGQHPKLVVCYTNQNGVKNNLSALNEINIYPNPVNNNLTVTLGSSQKVEISVINVLGENFNLEVTKFNESVQVNTESLPKGNYAVCIKNISTGQITYLKFMKE